MGALVERHYTRAGEITTKNLAGVITPIPSEKYNAAVERINTIGKSAERRLGKVTDHASYYFFTGSNVFLENGLAQVGSAKTADNTNGFGMIRLFANSIEGMQQLEKECGFGF